MDDYRFVNTLFSKPSTFGTLSWTYSRSRRCLLSFCCRRKEASATDRTVAYGTNLLEEIVDVEVHLQNRLLSPLVVKSNNECAGGRRGDIEVDIRATVITP